ncbi:TIGR00366 family protein [Dermacoccus abyssi]|uniref:TIGR00366 family protein n=1 Tax=Dermacoccus abyssi TaxID=322596 RepID=UPI0021A6A847|nr:TIGR00366 family protein [Dermacoccus abyssi]
MVVVGAAALINGASPKVVAESFGGGFWDLAAFTRQMSMVVLTGYVVATSPPVARLIERLAHVPSSPRTAVAYVCLLAMSVSLLNWASASSSVACSPVRWLAATTSSSTIGRSAPLLHLPVVILLVWLLGMTFSFEPPVQPAP